MQLSHSHTNMYYHSDQPKFGLKEVPPLSHFSPFALVSIEEFDHRCRSLNSDECVEPLPLIVAMSSMFEAGRERRGEVELSQSSTPVVVAWRQQQSEDDNVAPSADTDAQVLRLNAAVDGDPRKRCDIAQKQGQIAHSLRHCCCCCAR